jgi:hypothetical protein
MRALRILRKHQRIAAHLTSNGQRQLPRGPFFVTQIPAAAGFAVEEIGERQHYRANPRAFGPCGNARARLREAQSSRAELEGFAEEETPLRSVR